MGEKKTHIHWNAVYEGVDLDVKSSSLWNVKK